MCGACALGPFTVQQGVVFQQLMGLQVFWFLLLQPFRFSRNCHLYEFVSSLCIPRILYLGYCHVAVNRELLLSSGNKFIPESTLMLQKGEKVKTASAWGWLSHFSLGFTYFSILVASPLALIKSHWISLPLNCVFLPPWAIIRQLLLSHHNMSSNVIVLCDALIYSST